VARGDGDDLAGGRFKFGTVGHDDVQPSAQLVLLVRGHAELGAGDRLHVLRPTPTGLEGDPPDLGTPGKVDQLHPPVLSFADLVWSVEGHLLYGLGVAHRCSSKVKVLIGIST
jgi:hypothetical protein